MNLFIEDVFENPLCTLASSIQLVDCQYNPESLGRAFFGVNNANMVRYAAFPTLVF